MKKGNRKWPAARVFSTSAGDKNWKSKGHFLRLSGVAKPVRSRRGAERVAQANG